MKTVIIWLAMVLVISVYPVNSDVASGGIADKVFHAFLYAITCLLFYTFLRERAVRRPLLLAVLLSTGVGILMELAQEFTTTRQYSNYDVLANFTGAAASALYLWTGRSLAKRGKKP